MSVLRTLVNAYRPDPRADSPLYILYEVVATTLQQPLELTKTLIQLGYEPFPPVEGRRFGIGPKCLLLSSPFQYVRYIKSVDDLIGCFRGLAPRICVNIVSNVVSKQVAIRLRLGPDRWKKGSSMKDEDNSKTKDFLLMAKQAGSTIIFTSAGTIASQPFFVIACRAMAQFVGREGKYCSIMEAVQTIFKEEGILGFFSGLTARVLADIVFLTVSFTMVQLMKICFQTALKDNTTKVPFLGGTISQNVAYIITNSADIIGGLFAQKFHVVAGVMAVNDCGLALGRYPFTARCDGWYECWKDMSRGEEIWFASSKMWGGLLSDCYVIFGGRTYAGPVITIGGYRTPVGVYFGPQHPPGLGRMNGPRRVVNKIFRYFD